jgi:hypothetical protein
VSGTFGGCRAVADDAVRVNLIINSLWITFVDDDSRQALPRGTGYRTQENGDNREEAGYGRVL